MSLLCIYSQSLSNTQDVEKQLLAVKSLEPSIQVISQIQPVSTEICWYMTCQSRVGKGVTDLLQILMENEEWEEDKSHIQSLLWCFHFCIAFDSVKVVFLSFPNNSFLPHKFITHCTFTAVAFRKFNRFTHYRTYFSLLSLKV